MGSSAAPAPYSLAEPRRTLAGSAPTHGGVIRLVAFALLAFYAALEWARQVEPAGSGPALRGVAAGCALGGVLIAVGRRPARSHVAMTTVGAVVLAILVVVLSSGVPLRLFWFDAWGDLVAGIGQGLQAVPELRVPYRGADEWVRTVVLAGGGLLVVLAAVLAFAPIPGINGSPLPAAVALGVLFAVPVVERNPRSPFLAGAMFALLLAAFLWADRLRADQAGLAIALTATAVLVAAAFAPRLDAARPWIDYEHLADRLRPQAATRFDWNHRYAALNWPRDGREALRIAARSSAYWKGVALDEFDGIRWREPARRDPGIPDTQVFNHPEWRQSVRVVVRDIVSRQFYAPGNILAIKRFQRPALRRGGGTFVTGTRPLGPGDSYVADVYSPRPTVADMRDAGSLYPDFAFGQLTMGLPARVGGPVTANPQTGATDPASYNIIAFSPWGQNGPPRRITPNGVAFLDASGTIAGSDYARMYRLARRLRAAASSPYDLVQRVSRRVRRNAVYTEAPPSARVPLDAFLFTDHQGYCQQFSGAMALLLRMAGVPARVAAGFAPGRFDQQRKEYVVRDLDAHSWVEVYFPRIGWVPFDPTPASAPPSSQASSDSFANAAAGNAADAGGVGDRGSDPGAGGAGADGGRPWVLPGVLSLVALIAALGAFAGHRRTRPRLVGDGLDELRLVLQRTGRPLTAEITLQRLEQRMAGDARDYVRALRLARYGGGAPTPTAAQRAALRRELAEGLGVLGRLRAWSALPPRLRLGLGRVRRRQV